MASVQTVLSKVNETIDRKYQFCYAGQKFNHKKAFEYKNLLSDVSYFPLRRKNNNFYMGTGGGVADTILIGREADIRSQTRKTLGSALIVSGCLLVMGLYHLLLYLIRPQDRSTLYFGLLCLDLGIWFLASNSAEYFLLDLLPIHQSRLQQTGRQRLVSCGIYGPFAFR